MNESETSMRENGPPPVPVYQYTTRGRKIADWFLGFVGFFLLAALVSGFGGVMMNVWGMGVLTPLTSVGSLVVFIMLAVHFGRAGRRFIVLGAVSAIVLTSLIPLLAIGACFLFVLSQ